MYKVSCSIKDVIQTHDFKTLSKAIKFYEKERFKFNSDEAGWLTFKEKSNIFKLLSLNEVRSAWTGVVISKPSAQYSGWFITKQREQFIW